MGGVIYLEGEGEGRREGEGGGREGGGGGGGGKEMAGEKVEKEHHSSDLPSHSLSPPTHVEWGLSEANLTYGESIGKGEFGEVLTGAYRDTQVHE